MNFIVAVDGSAHSERALEYALGLAEAMAEPATVTVAYAVDPAVQTQQRVESISSFSEADRSLVLEDPETAEERGMAILEAVAERAAGREPTVETELLYGAPVSALTEYVESVEADGLVVGHRGLGEEYERVLGSTAKELVERSSVPVTVVN